MVRLKEVETRKKEENPLLSCAQTYIKVILCLINACLASNH
ncbi:hypothetical protein Goari_017305 [Gossypium aridum]|uniref:Uncharacterized protein n=1 Tax=Gossypium aridum TaxID=34290 RepID=A0A7J8WLN1_GOSAI|nr:hypothetical protein [Gossypium aridum]